MGNKYLKKVLCALIIVIVAVALFVLWFFDRKPSNSDAIELNDEDNLLKLEVSIEDFYLKKTGDPANFYYIDKENVLWGSGRNEYGQLGQGTQDYEFYEEAVKIAENIVHVTFSQKGFVIYLTNDNKLYGVGNAGCGALQQYTEFDWNKYVNAEQYSIATPVLLMEDVVYACCGKDDVVCLKKDGTVWTWGTVFVQGNSSTHNAYYIQKPKQILENAVLVTGGWFNHAALLQDGTVWTWGYNSSGNCGVANSSVVKEPTMVAKDVVMVWTDLAATLESPPDGTIRAGKTQYNVDYDSITEFNGEYPYLLNNTVIKKTDGSYWICGENVGTEEKVVHGAEADYTVICTHEFQPYELSANTVNEQEGVVNDDNVDEISLYVVETIMAMDQAYAEEKEAIIKIISNFSDIDYENARVLDSCQNEIIEGDVLLLIANNAEKDIKVYGYKSEEYTCRGIIIRYGGINSYFDYSWDDIRGPRGLYVADFDKDGKDEIAICLSGGHGTGHSVERLIIFEESDESRQLVSYELTSEKQQSEIERILDFDIDLANWEFIVNRNGQSERVIDIKKHASRNSNNEFGIDYLNNIHYEVQNDKIVMYTKVGIEFDTFKGFTVGFQNDEGKIGFDVIYEDEQFRLE